MSPHPNARFEQYIWEGKIITVQGGDDVAVPSYDIDSNVWVLDWGSPFVPGSPWQILKLFTGWNNIASVGTVLAYCFFWVGMSAILIYMKLSSRKGKSQV